MIEVFVLIILILFVVYLGYLLANSLLLALINLALLWVLVTRIVVETKNKEYILYYLIGGGISIALYISKEYMGIINGIFKFLSKAMVIETVQILLLTFVITQVIVFFHKQMKKGIK